jgi:alkylation response protein AidB-like acyl-CoA dehydrogenase
MDWLQRVHNLAPLVEQHRDEGERQRRLPQPLFQAMRDAGLFSLWVPSNLGGAEVDVETSMRVVERCFRDVHVVQQHAVVSPSGIVMAGRHFQGLSES